MSRTTKLVPMSSREPTMPVRSTKKEEPDDSCPSCGRMAGCNCVKLMDDVGWELEMEARAKELGLTIDEYLVISDEELEALDAKLDEETLLRISLE